ncbi:hypothetical protein LCGC14_0426600 [marine sediment metagenome]|uniref:Uncharacterized protein n=1 Tax=marine sediment metagenome TaxID=412755 RepID=A0A0F9T7F9_9ZZZZ
MIRTIEVESQTEELYTVCVKSMDINDKWGPICDNGEGNCMNVYKTIEIAQKRVHSYQDDHQEAKVMRIHFSTIKQGE